MEDFLLDAAKTQEKWDAMMCSGQVTKKEMCDICVPFRDKYGLTDREALAVARSEFSYVQLVTLAKEKVSEREPDCGETDVQRRRRKRVSYI